MCKTFFFFFFQAEDGIRDYKVTGVQTCALPIFAWSGGAGCAGIHWSPARTTFATGRAEFEFALVGNKPFLVTEDDQSFLIDTGASGMIVSEEMARRGGDRIQPVRVRARMSDARDRKSTRLNSSHLVISNAGFCLKQ